MSLVESAQSHALEVRNRLRRPPNAVFDRPINLKFKDGKDPNAVKLVIPINIVDNEQENKNANHIKELQDKCASLQGQLHSLIHKLSTDKTIKSPTYFVLPTTEKQENKRQNKWPPEFTLAIKRAVAAEFHVSVNDIVSSRRDWQVMIPRHTAIYLTKVLTLKSLPEIGRQFGNRDHTTCLSAIRKMPNRMAADSDLYHRVLMLQTKLETVIENWRAEAQ